MILLTGDRGTTEYRNSNINDSVDATTAIFHQRHNTSVGDYPFNVTGAAGNSGLQFLGGIVLGGVDNRDWDTLYHVEDGNSAALRIENCPGAVIKGWQFKSDPALSQPRYVWDAIRFAGTTDNWVIEDILMEGCRDDGIENEQGGAGIIKNCRFYDCFVFLGTDGANAGGKTLRIENTLISMGLHLYNGRVTHQSPFKTNNSNAGFNPNFVLDNVVIAVRDPAHEGASGSGSRLAIAFQRMTSVTNSHYLNLSDTPLNYSYPIPTGFTVLQGQAARDYWAARVAAWGTSPPDPNPEPEEPTLEEIAAALAALQAALAAQAAATDARFDALEATVAGIQAPDLTPINAALAALDARLDAISAAAGG